MPSNVTAVGKHKFYENHLFKYGWLYVASNQPCKKLKWNEDDCWRQGWEPDVENVLQIFS